MFKNLSFCKNRLVPQAIEQLGDSTPKSSRHSLSINILLVYKFQEKLLMKKSSECKYDLNHGQASEPNSRIGKHLLLTDLLTTFS